MADQPTDAERLAALQLKAELLSRRLVDLQLAAAELAAAIGDVQQTLVGMTGEEKEP